MAGFLTESQSVSILNCHSLAQIRIIALEGGCAPSYLNQAIKCLNLNHFSGVDIFTPEMLIRRPNRGFFPPFSL